MRLATSVTTVISKFLKRHPKAKLRAPAYSLAPRKIRGVVQPLVWAAVSKRLDRNAQRMRDSAWPLNGHTEPPRRLVSAERR